MGIASLIDGSKNEAMAVCLGLRVAQTIGEPPDVQSTAVPILTTGYLCHSHIAHSMVTVPVSSPQHGAFCLCGVLVNAVCLGQPPRPTRRNKRCPSCAAVAFRRSPPPPLLLRRPQRQPTAPPCRDSDGGRRAKAWAKQPTRPAADAVVKGKRERTKPVKDACFGNMDVLTRVAGFIPAMLPGVVLVVWRLCHRQAR